MISVAICDDEANVRSYLSSLVKNQNMECEITEYASVREYLSADPEHDLLFLDIEMRDSSSGMCGDACENGMYKAADKNGMCKATYKNGMWLAREIRSRDKGKQPIIIFVTGYQEYVFEAFDVDAFHFLVKPVNTQKFADVFHKAVRQIAARQEYERETSRQGNLKIQYKNASKVIPYNHIYYVESRNHKAVIHAREGEFEYYARMEDLERELAGQFYRIHRGYLINLSYVDEYNRQEVTLTNGDKLLISKYKFDSFVRAYLDYVAEDGL